MMRSGIYKAVFFLLCMQYPVFSSTWSDSLIAALSANEPAAVFRLSKNQHCQGPRAPFFSFRHLFQNQSNRSIDGRPSRTG